MIIIIVFCVSFLIFPSTLFCAAVDDSDEHQVMYALPQTVELAQKVVQVIKPHGTHPHAWERYLNECDPVEYSQIGDAVQSGKPSFEKYLQEQNSQVLTYWLTQLAETHDQVLDQYDQDAADFVTQLKEKDTALQALRDEKEQSVYQLNKLKRRFERAEEGRKHYQNKAKKKKKRSEKKEE